MNQVPNKEICKYGCSARYKLCCFLCDKRPCPLACTKPCDRLRVYYDNEPQVVIHYAKLGGKPVLSHGVDPIWRETPGRAVTLAKGPGPRSALVETPHGMVVVPRLNLKWRKKAQ